MTPPVVGLRAVQVEAQAKINLRLRILAREVSGFHQIETLFLRVALADTVRVRRTSGARSLDVGGAVDLSAIGAVEDNLAWRAAESFLAASGERDGFAIEIEKRIPLGGGLGGGSADAGAVLRALNATSETPLHEQTLLHIAQRLGSDVPFLASDHAYALAWGRGERMLSLAPPPSRPVLLVLPDFSVSTADAYAWLDAQRAEGGRRERLDLASLHVGDLGDWRALQDVAINDFEWPVPMRHPELLDYLNRLSRLGSGLSLMSGSGSTVFGVGVNREDGGPIVLGATATAAFKDAACTLVRTVTSERVEPVSPIE